MRPSRIHGLGSGWPRGSRRLHAGAFRCGGRKNHADQAMAGDSEVVHPDKWSERDWVDKTNSWNENETNCSEEAAVTREKVKATAWGLIATVGLALLILLGSRRLVDFDAALVGYTFATLFAALGIAYRYSMWLQQPPTAMFWKRGWQLFFAHGYLLTNLGQLVYRLGVMFALNRFIWRRSPERGAAHFLIMWRSE